MECKKNLVGIPLLLGVPVELAGDCRVVVDEELDQLDQGQLEQALREGKQVEVGNYVLIPQEDGSVQMVGSRECIE